MPNKTDRRSDRVWDRLIQCYGTRVADAYGVDIPKPWVDALEGLTDDQIAHGLRMIIGITPVHPPTLGQFVQTCANMPIAQVKAIATIQEQLCAYAILKIDSRLNPLERSNPWTYMYREWWDATRPKGMEKCAECVGVMINLEDGSRMGFSVAEMLADSEGHQRALRSFKPGPKPARELPWKAA